jgi:hypothetical protein
MIFADSVWLGAGGGYAVHAEYAVVLPICLPASGPGGFRRRAFLRWAQLRCMAFAWLRHIWAAWGIGLGLLGLLHSRSPAPPVVW